MLSAGLSVSEGDVGVGVLRLFVLAVSYRRVGRDEAAVICSCAVLFRALL